MALSLIRRGIGGQACQLGRNELVDLCKIHSVRDGEIFKIRMTIFMFLMVCSVVMQKARWQTHRDHSLWWRQMVIVCRSALCTYHCMLTPQLCIKAYAPSGVQYDPSGSRCN